MLGKWLTSFKQKLSRGKYWVIARLIRSFVRLLMSTCHIHIEGLSRFCSLAAEKKCFLMLWHNRLALVPFILDHYTPRYLYAALISNSRDGHILDAIVASYKNGRPFASLIEHAIVPFTN